MNRFAGKTALITGASSGMGSEYARILARSGVNLILTARRETALQELQSELQDTGCRITCIPHDLGVDGAADVLWDRIAAAGLQVDILINNAGYGAYGPFNEIPREKEATMIQLDIVSLLQLTRLAARDMAARGWGRILQVASVAAYQPSPGVASYAAAKSFVLNYSLAVREELRGSGVSVTVLSPGVTRTEFFDAADFAELSWFQKLTMMSAERAAGIGLRALQRRRKMVVAGYLNSLLVFTNRFVGRGAAARIARRLMTP